MLGKDVLYRLGELDVQAIGALREKAKAHGQRGNQVGIDEVYPAKIVRVWNEHTVNLQVYLDGNDIYWTTSAMRGEGLSQWNFSDRV